MNKIKGYYTNNGETCDLSESDYIQIELLGNHAKQNDSNILISKNSISVVINYNWYLGKNGYPVTYGTVDNKIRYGKGIKLHKLLFPNIEKGLVVDHINHNKLDNRMENLRVCTSKQNSYNTKKSINSKYKYKGIIQQNNGLWTARIHKDGNLYEIKDIDTDKNAAYTYDMMAEELFGIYAGKNFN